MEDLNDQELESRFRNAVTAERATLREVLELIREIDRRKLYLKRAKPSLFEYLVDEFGYSPAAAQRRIDAARLSKEVENLLERVEAGSLNLTQISIVQKGFRQKEKIEPVPLSSKLELLDRIHSSSGRETEKIVAQHLEISLIYKTSLVPQRDGSVRLALTLLEEPWRFLSRCKELLGHKIASGDLAEVLAEVCRYYLEKRDPLLRTATSAAEVTPQQKLFGPFSASLRRFIFQRDKVCQFKDQETSRLCGSKFRLEIDHIRMRSQGGTNEPENLRLLCRQHNQLLALSPIVRSGRTPRGACPSR